ncbi:MAG TPA: polyhydroxyalkanoic acid system family protein [Usitatibacter sp.]|nr:polyhydroxyalkanoic acid system family protein [Usitatibacter sp.]
MADIEIRRVHNLGLEAARKAADRMAERLGQRFGLKGSWRGNVMHFERPGVTGSLALTDKDLDLQVTLGMLLRMMKGSLEGAVHEELDQLFAKAPSPRPSPKAVGVKPKKAASRPKKVD